MSRFVCFYPFSAEPLFLFTASSITYNCIHQRPLPPWLSSFQHALIILCRDSVTSMATTLFTSSNLVAWVDATTTLTLVTMIAAMYPTHPMKTLPTRTTTMPATTAVMSAVTHVIIRVALSLHPNRRRRRSALSHHQNSGRLPKDGLAIGPPPPDSSNVLVAIFGVMTSETTTNTQTAATVNTLMSTRMDAKRFIVIMKTMVRKWSHPRSPFNEPIASGDS